MELQIQKDLVSTGFDLPNDLRPFGIEKLHTDLHIGFLARELVKKGQRFFLTTEITSNDDVFSHQWAPPIMLLISCTPSSSRSAGRACMISWQAYGLTRLAAPTWTAVAPANIISTTSCAV